MAPFETARNSHLLRVGSDLRTGRDVLTQGICGETHCSRTQLYSRQFLEYFGEDEAAHLELGPDVVFRQK
jgi:hypothetical protein